MTTHRQELKIIKSNTQTTLEIVELLVTVGVVYYLLQPSQREKHVAYLRAKRNMVHHWISVHHTIKAIRNLPEIDVQM